MRPSPSLAAASSRPTPAPTALPSAASPSASLPLAADAELLALIAESVHQRSDCAPIAATPDFATARSTVVCRFRSGTITGVTVRLYDDPAAAEAAYVGWQDTLHDHGVACEDDSFEGPWSRDGREGRLLCYVADDGLAYLFWTDTEIPVVGLAWRTDGYLKGLYSWWVERYPLAI